MNLYELNVYLNDEEKLNNKLNELINNKTIKQQDIDEDEIRGHIMKSVHNLKFITDNIKLKYFDWAIIGCYYASYHSALALILTKNYSSKNHLATLLILIKEFYNRGLNKQELEDLAKLLDYQDILFYVESKDKREKATYTTRINFDKKEVEEIKLKSSLFVSKIKNMLNL